MREYMTLGEPDGWQLRRTKWTWGILFLALVVGGVAQYLSQIIAGAIVGGTVGLAGLARITSSDAALLNQGAWWSNIILIVVVVGYVVGHTRDDLTWRPPGSYDRTWGVQWWRSFWQPILLGAFANAAIFGVMMAGWAAV